MMGEPKRVHCAVCDTTYLQGERHACASSDDYIPRGPVTGTAQEAIPKSHERGILNERGSTHGDFVENGKIMQALKQLMREHWKWAQLAPEQREALEMIQHKIGRILCGDHNYFDHWRDIAGYAKLIEERLTE